MTEANTEITNSDFLNTIWAAITFEMIIKLAIIYFFIIWIAVIVWVIKDVSNRTNNIFLQIFSILLVVFLTPL